jgi:hypothetical protein
LDLGLGGPGTVGQLKSQTLGGPLALHRFSVLLLLLLVLGDNLLGHLLDLSTQGIALPVGRNLKLHFTLQ